MNTQKNYYSFTRMRLGGLKKSGGQRLISSRAYASISTSAKRRRSLQIQRQIRAASLGGVPETRGDSCAKRRCASVFRKRSRGWVQLFRQQRCGGANGNYSSKKTSSPRFPHGRRMRVALFLCMGKAFYKFYSTQLALPTRKTVEAEKDVRVPCRHGRQHQTLHPERAPSHQPCAQHQAWVVHSHSLCQTKGRGLRRPTSPKGQDSYPVPQVGLAQALAIHQAGSRCRCRCVAPSYPYTRPARCPPLSRDNTPRLGSGARLRSNHGRRPRVWARHN
jgi:hypothetical protein